MDLQIFIDKLSINLCLYRVKFSKSNFKGLFKNKEHDIESDRPTDFCNFLS